MGVYTVGVAGMAVDHVPSGSGGSTPSAPNIIIMKIIEFKANVTQDVAFEILDYFATTSLRISLAPRLQKLNIQGRTNFLKYRLAWPDSNKIERVKYYPSFLEKATIEDWIIWFSNSSLISIENILSNYDIKNTRITAILNESFDDDVEDDIPPEPKETWD